MTTQRQASRQEWNSGNTIAEINSGSLQRIADATELMAQNFLQLQADRDAYKRWYKEEVDKNAKLQRQVNAYRGIVKKLKK